MIKNSQITTQRSPIADMDCSFSSYMTHRKAENARHIINADLPDYAYGLDYDLHKKLDAIPGLHKLVSNMYATVASTALQNLNRRSVAVTPTQFPDVYDMACDCARRLGMAVPNVYIVNDQTLNAGAYCMDDTQPVIEINSGLYERLTPGEIKAILGHECGHIQNNHMIYKALVEMIANDKLNDLQYTNPALCILLSKATLYALNTWSRAAEVSADRAGMICADTPEDAHNANLKLMYGATLKEQEIDMSAIEDQFKQQMSNMARLDEMLDSHPGTASRIMAEKEFAQCSLFYDWRPDLKKPDMVLRSKEECDARCKEFIGLMSKKSAGDK